MAGDRSELRVSLHEAEQHFSQLVAGVQDYAIFLLDRSGVIKSWNAGAQRIKGYSAEEIIGSNFSRFYPPDAIASKWPQQELEIAKSEGRFEDEGWRIRKDGSQFWSNVVITPFYGSKADLLGFLKITRDLTERKEAEESLRRSEERFRLLVEGVKEYAIFMLDPSGNIASWNSGAQRIKGYAAAEIIGKHFSVFYSSEDVASGKPDRELREAKESGSVEDEGWRVKKDGSLFWANVVITAIYDEEEKLVGFAKVTRDMTEKRQITELAVADRQKNEFLAILAHELRNPLAPISNGLQLLKLQNVDSTTLTQTTALMERQLDHMIRLIDDLLDISRIITGKLSFSTAPIELSAVIRDSIEESKESIDAKGHELMVQMSARSIVVDADRNRLTQVITNLLENAAKYTDKPSQIWLSAETHGNTARIRVTDSGIGISAEVLPRIFDLFVQADNSLARPRGGLGIGLNVVKRIVEMHGGVVEAKSMGLGLGSEFLVTLPLTAKLPATAPAAAIPENSSSLTRRILVVDDNVEAAVTITSLLRAWGHVVRTAYDGQAALEIARSFRPEIVLLDVGLPGMSGYDVAKRLRQEPAVQHAVIAALTGYGQESDRERAFASGFNYHFTKPADPELLESMIVASHAHSIDD